MGINDIQRSVDLSGTNVNLTLNKSRMNMFVGYMFYRSPGVLAGTKDCDLVPLHVLGWFYSRDIPRASVYSVVF
jgi:hypothetical protein